MKTKDTTPSTSTATALLLVSAFMLAAMIIFQAGRIPSSSAHAGDAVTGSEGYTLLTVSSGFGKDSRPYELCYVIDNHDEMLYIYEVPQASDKRVILRYGNQLTGLFTQARGGS